MVDRNRHTDRQTDTDGRGGEGGTEREGEGRERGGEGREVASRQK